MATSRLISMKRVSARLLAPIAVDSSRRIPMHCQWYEWFRRAIPARSVASQRGRVKRGAREQFCRGKAKPAQEIVPSLARLRLR
jgi:hypothetical protein